MSADNDTVQTARSSYDPTLLAEAAGFAEVAEPPRVLSLEPLDLDLGDLGDEAEEANAPSTPQEEPREAAVPPCASPLDGTLVLAVSALTATDKTLVLPAPVPRQVEHTLVIAAPPVTVLQTAGATSDGAAATRIVPLEEWAPEAAASAPDRRTAPAADAANGRPGGPLSGLLQQFRQMPVRRRVMVVLAPITALALLSSYLGPSPAEEARPAPVSRAPAPRAAANLSRSVTAAAPAATATAPGPARPAPSARAASGKTLQRAAADAVAEGNAAAALALYKQLAAAEPHVPAYRAATRILEERVRGAEQAER